MLPNLPRVAYSNSFRSILLFSPPIPLPREKRLQPFCGHTIISCQRWDYCSFILCMHPRWHPAVHKAELGDEGAVWNDGMLDEWLAKFLVCYKVKQSWYCAGFGMLSFEPKFSDIGLHFWLKAWIWGNSFGTYMYCLIAELFRRTFQSSNLIGQYIAQLHVYMHMHRCPSNTPKLTIIQLIGLELWSTLQYCMFSFLGFPSVLLIWSLTVNCMQTKQGKAWKIILPAWYQCKRYTELREGILPPWTMSGTFSVL